MADSAEWIEELHARGVTDGLPVVPPTPERVRAAVEASGRLAHELVGLVAPQFGRATVEKVAVNAVMAGCRSEYLPVVRAAVEAICDPDFALVVVSGTTDAVAPLLILNGPVRRALDVNCGVGVFGPGWRANASIGRAVRFVWANIGGARPGGISMSTFAQPGRYTYCIGENEEENPWAALHVECGFAATDSTVAALAAEAPQIVADTQSRRAEDIAITIARSGEVIASHKLGGLGDAMLVLGPEHLRTMAGDGWSKADVRRFVWEHTQASVEGTRVAKFRQPTTSRSSSRGGRRAAFRHGSPVDHSATRPPRSSSRRSAGSEGRAPHHARREEAAKVTRTKLARVRTGARLNGIV